MRTRRAVPEDIEQLASLFDQYRTFYGKTPDLNLAKSFLQERMLKEQSVILVAETEPGDLAGFTQLYPSFSSLSAATVYVLNDLFVAPDHRREGVAQALLEAAEAFARESGAVQLSLSTAMTNDPAQSLYEGMGWTRDQEFYHYALAIK